MYMYLQIYITRSTESYNLPRFVDPLSQLLDVGVIVRYDSYM